MPRGATVKPSATLESSLYVSGMSDGVAKYSGVVTAYVAKDAPRVLTATADGLSAAKVTLDSKAP